MRNRYLFVIDVILLPAAVYISYWLRLENFDLKQFAPGWLLFTALSIVVVPVVFYLCGIYRRYWLYASVEEVLILIT
ncbi:MAG TPA: polysaccharide biosynthesis protein, partial [Anaerolineae bacterium]